MKTITLKRTICKFEELSAENKAKAIERNRDFNTENSFWHECVTEDAAEIAALMGIDIDHVYFRGFCSQGDGACFVGSFSYRKGMLKAVLSYAPQDKELHRIAKQIQELHRLNFYRTYGRITHSCHYYHERSMSVDCDTHEDEWRDVFADFAQWIYRRLETEYDYQNSDEVIADSLIANEVEFTLDKSGTLLH